MSEKESLRPLLTQWGEELDKGCPLHEYPRPQLRRAGWMCLNGTWQYAIVEHADAYDAPPPEAWDGDILVPFSPESLLSGVQRQLLPGQTLWYRRTLTLAPPVEGDRLLLHFGAVDQRCRVLCNGVEAGRHTGGYWPFSFDVTKLMHTGENEICVSVADDANTGDEAYGKQTLRRGGIWYTAQSGIWQTVWCEHVPAQYIESVRITPLWRTGAVRLAVTLAGTPDSARDDAEGSTDDKAAREGAQGAPSDFAAQLRTADAANSEYAKNIPGGAVPETEESFATATPPTHSAAPRVSAVIFDASGRAVTHADFPAGQIAELPVPGAQSWTPDDPYLYTVSLTVGADEVESYFGMREFGTGQDARGNPCLTLNGAPIFHSGLLDQGYWSDGMYTPPADAAMVWDIQQMKALGFNMLRKHIKIEPLRWYYHCDRLGMLVWQDFVSGGGPYHSLVTQVLPFVGVRLQDSRYKWFGRESEAGRAAALRDAQRTVSLLYNCTSLAVWVPFNEGWGQFDAAQMCGTVRTLDGTRPIDHASGWHDQNAGDFQSYHIYYKEFRPRPDGSERVLALTEFGGYSMPVQEHMASARRFGYKIYETPAALNDAVEMLYYREVLPAVAQGLAAAVYTQVSDVEDEINGVVTYDRRVVKLDAQTFCALHKELYAAFYGKIER